MKARVRRPTLCAALQLDLLEPERVLLATCKVSVATEDGKPPEWIEIVPAGPEVKAVDGRKFRNTQPERILEAFRAYQATNGTDIPIDWEHATEIRAPEGDPAPAAGWITQLEVRGGAVWARVEWTPRGAASLASREYRYISPAFHHDKKTGEILSLVSAGLTNRPALTQLPALAAAWATSYVNDLPDSAFLFIEAGGEKDADGKTTPRSLRHLPYRDKDGAVDLPHLRNALARLDSLEAKGADKDAIRKHAEKLLAKETPKAKASATGDTDMALPKELTKILGLKEDADGDEVVAALRALHEKHTKLADEHKAMCAEHEKLKKQFEESGKAKAAAETELATLRAATSDPSKFVPRADHELALARVKKLEDDAAAAKASALKTRAEGLVADAMKAGKIAPSSKDWYLGLCSTEDGLTNVEKHLAAAPVVVTPGALPHFDGKPAGEGDVVLTQAERDAARLSGISEDEMKKSKAQLRAQAARGAGIEIDD